MREVNGENFTFLIGKRIIKVDIIDNGYTDKYKLTCDDGTILTIETNEGCGGCGNGWSEFGDLKKLEENNNVITNIDVKYDGDDEFTMFVYYEDGSINKLNGNDGWGNGWYGGGFYLTVTKVEEGEE